VAPTALRWTGRCRGSPEIRSEECDRNNRDGEAILRNGSLGTTSATGYPLLNEAGGAMRSLFYGVDEMFRDPRSKRSDALRCEHKRIGPLDIVRSTVSARPMARGERNHAERGEEHRRRVCEKVGLAAPDQIATARSKRHLGGYENDHAILAAEQTTTGLTLT